jgi:hypothetical protein
MFNNKEDLKEWIINYINTKGKRSLHIAINNSKYIKNFILEQTSYLPNSAIPHCCRQTRD